MVILWKINVPTLIIPSWVISGKATSLNVVHISLLSRSGTNTVQSLHAEVKEVGVFPHTVIALAKRLVICMCVCASLWQHSWIYGIPLCYTIREWGRPCDKTHLLSKSSFGTESNLKSISNPKFRVALSKLRASSHDLVKKRCLYVRPKLNIDTYIYMYMYISTLLRLMFLTCTLSDLVLLVDLRYCLFLNLPFHSYVFLLTALLLSFYNYYVRVCSILRICTFSEMTKKMVNQWINLGSGRQNFLGVLGSLKVSERYHIITHRVAKCILRYHNTLDIFLSDDTNRCSLKCPSKISAKVVLKTYIVNYNNWYRHSYLHQYILYHIT